MAKWDGIVEIYTNTTDDAFAVRLALFSPIVFHHEVEVQLANVNLALCGPCL